MPDDPGPRNQVRTQILRLLRGARIELDEVMDHVGDARAKAEAFAELDEIITFVDSRGAPTPTPLQTTHYSKSTVTCGRIAVVHRDRWQLEIKLATGEEIVAGLSQVTRNGQADAMPGDAWVDTLKAGEAVDVVRDSVNTVIGVRMPPWNDKHHRPRRADEIPA